MDNQQKEEVTDEDILKMMTLAEKICQSQGSDSAKDAAMALVRVCNVPSQEAEKLTSLKRKKSSIKKTPSFNTDRLSGKNLTFEPIAILGTSAVCAIKYYIFTFNGYLFPLSYRWCQ